MEADVYVKSLAAVMAWREAGEFGANAMHGVLFTIRNRVNKGWGDWYHVVTAQLLLMSTVNSSYAINFPDPRDPMFQKVLYNVDFIYKDAPDKLTGGALYWANLQSPMFHANGLLAHIRDKERVAEIGGLTFFK